MAEAGPSWLVFYVVLGMVSSSWEAKLQAMQQQTLFRFDFSQESFPTSERRAVACRALKAGQVDTIARWIRLELDADTMIEARPEAGALFFSSPTLTPLKAPFPVSAGDEVRIGGSHDSRKILTWIEHGKGAASP